MKRGFAAALVSALAGLEASAVAVGLGQRDAQTGSRVALRDVVSANGASAPAKAFGDPKCPCVGFDNLDGKTLVTFENGAVGSYPSDLGARCEAWDTGELVPGPSFFA